MSSSGQGTPEDSFDNALQRIVDGASVEEIMAANPGLNSEEVEPLLRAAQGIRRGPHPQLASEKIAAMVARAQEQVRSGAPLLNGHREDEPTVPLPVKVPTPRTTAVRPEQKAKVRAAAFPWLSRLYSRLRLDSPALRAAGAFAVLVAALVGIVIFARMTQPPNITVPQVTRVAFSYDGNIEQITPDSWTIGGYAVEIDSNTKITGVPTVGARAHVEGQLLIDNRRLASLISVQALGPTITPAPPITATGVVSGPPIPGETPATSPTGGVLPQPEIVVGTPAGKPTVIPAGAPATPVSGVIVHPTRTTTVATAPPRPATATPRSRTAWPPTATVPKPSTTAPRPTNTAQATRTRVPTAISTNTLQPEPSWTRTPTPVPTVSPSATSRPAVTRTPTNEPEGTATEEPTATNEPAPTATTRPTSPPEPTETHAPTSTPVPTQTPVLTPTRVPSHTPSVEPTETPKPSETATSTVVVPPLTPTPQVTETQNPDETHTPDPTHSGEESQTPEPTHGPDGTHGPEPSVTP